MRARLFRLWLVVALPLACLAGYEAWSAHQSSVEWQRSVTLWYEAMNDTSGRQHFGAPSEQFHTSVDNRDREDRRTILFGCGATVLLVLPLIFALLHKVFGWVWSGSKAETK